MRLGSLLLLAFACTAPVAAQDLTVFPAEVRLVGRGAVQRLLVTGRKDGRAVDRTRDARYTSESPNVAKVGPGGVVAAAGSGHGRIRVEADGQSATVEVHVEQADRLPD